VSKQTEETGAEEKNGRQLKRNISSSGRRVERENPGKLSRGKRMKPSHHHYIKQHPLYPLSKCERDRELGGGAVS
jgi:hypothetical protein